MLYIKTTTRKQMLELIQYLYCTLKVTIDNQRTKPVLASLINYVVNARPTRRYLRFNENSMDMEGFPRYSCFHEHVTPRQFKRLMEAKLSQPEQPFTKEAPAFDLGFEIEGCVDHEARADLTTYLMDLYPDTPYDDLIHSDSSIEPYDTGIEIVTPPLPIDDAMERLEWLCGTLAILTEEGLFETNTTCGLHVNLSERKVFQSARHPVRNSFARHFLRSFKPMKWKRAFDRVNLDGAGRFCRWDHGAPKTIRTLHRYHNHYSAINIQHLHADAAARRIEVRVAGGKDYHVKTDKLRDYFLDIERAARQAHELI